MPVEPEQTPGFIAVFTTAQNAASYMAEREETEWQNKLVSRTTLPSLLESLRRMGIEGVCVDPANNGCETKIDLNDLES